MEKYLYDDELYSIYTKEDVLNYRIPNKENELIQNMASPVLTQNPNTFWFIGKLNLLLSLSIDVMVLPRNWFNIYIHKYYNKFDN